ncbi:glycosyltransferase [Specibacter sp. NPDC057265]|uniref:glycosyltransferase n=1 Tax=Specibacter sp. NPDC057265 TaxID=3346075 RepID=UPI0036296DDD
MKILVWHVHGGWMDAFVRGGHHYLLPTTDRGGPWGLGRAGRPWPETVQEVPVEQLRHSEIDVVVLQRMEEMDAVELLTGRRPGRDMPAIFVEHNTPKGAVPHSIHPLADQRGIVVAHVTHFNQMMWYSGRAPTVVIEHGVPDPGALYTGVLAEQAVVVNEPVRRGRVTGTDLLPQFTAAAPVTVYGMGGEQLAGSLGLPEHRLRWGGDLPASGLHAGLARHRLYLHPLRWTSLGLSLIEAMLLAMPVIVVDATEASRAVPPEAGAVSCNMAELLNAATLLLNDPGEAARRGKIAREAALAHYSLERFLRDWDVLLHECT